MKLKYLFSLVLLLVLAISTHASIVDLVPDYNLSYTRNGNVRSVYCYDNKCYYGSGSSTFWVNNTNLDDTEITRMNMSDFISNRELYSVLYNENRDILYVCGTVGTFGYINLSNNSLTSLKEADTDNWVASTDCVDMVFGKTKDIIYMVLDAGKFGRYNHTSGVFEDLSSTDVADWMSTTNLFRVEYDNVSDMAYTGADVGKFGVFNESDDTWYDLSATDAANWAGTNDVLSLAFDYNHNVVYTGLQAGRFGYYNITNSSWMNRFNQDTGNWVGTLVVNAMAYDGATDKVYMTASTRLGYYDINTDVATRTSTATEEAHLSAGNWLEATVIDELVIYTGGFSSILDYNTSSSAFRLYYNESVFYRFGSFNKMINTGNDMLYICGKGSAQLLTYNITSSVFSDLSATDTANWFSTRQCNDATYNPVSNRIYLAMEGGVFGYYDIATNVSTTLSATDPGNWWSTSILYDVEYVGNGLIVTGGQSGKYGIYNESDNIWYDKRSVDVGDFVGTTQINGQQYDASRNVVYIGLSGGKFGIHNLTSDVMIDKSDADYDNWIGTNIIYDFELTTDNNTLYIGTANGRYGYYDINLGNSTTLQNTDYNNFIAGDAVRSIGYDSLNDIYMLTAIDGKMGYYKEVTGVTKPIYQNTDPLSYERDFYHTLFLPAYNKTYVSGEFAMLLEYTYELPVFKIFNTNNTDILNINGVVNYTDIGGYYTR